MRLTKYITDLLYRYDCVIVPNFGGFICQKIPSKIDQKNSLIFPPSKKISFNALLKNNDGLLANHIAVSEKLNYSQALDFISKEVDVWNQKIKNDVLVLEKIGQFEANAEGQKLFSPDRNQNYLTASFGLPTIPIHTKSSATVLEKKTVEKPKFEMNPLLKYAAGVAVLMTLGLSLWQYDQVNKKKNYTLEVIHQDRVNDKIEQATFNIGKPLPAIKIEIDSNNQNLNNEENATYKPFHIITGAFSIKDNALNKVNQLQSKGYPAEIVGQNKWGLHQVAIMSFSSKEEAKSELKSVRSNISKDAWLLTK